MNRQRLERYLRSHGCRFDRHGGNHDRWLSADGTRKTSVPRHVEVKANTVRNICDDLNIPPPAER